MERGRQGERGGKLLLSSIDVVLWAISQRTPITRERILERWSVHRATSYRWVVPLEEARCRAQRMQYSTPPRYRTPMGIPPSLDVTV